ncbi:MAG: permease-like cell division protein FtsX [Gammaproteobacteria bacterium]
MRTESGGGTRHGARPRWRARLQALPEQHGHAAFSSLGRLWRAKAASLMSAGVAAIALALPLGLIVLVHNAAELAGASQGSAEISVFLKSDLDTGAIAAAGKAAASLPGVARERLITPEAAMAEFKQRAAFAQALAVLGTNPLPPVLVVTPSDTSLAGVKQLAGALGKVEGVDQVVADTEWVARLNAMLKIARRAVWVLGALLALAVLLVIGNTVRLEIQNRRTEIEVQKLVGATNAFVRRPFLYGGFWYGVIGGLLAWILVEIALALLARPVADLTYLYASDTGLEGPGFVGFFAILALGAVLGWLGALVAVGRHLRAIEPR